MYSYTLALFIYAQIVLFDSTDNCTSDPLNLGRTWRQMHTLILVWVIVTYVVIGLVILLVCCALCCLAAASRSSPN